MPETSPPPTVERLLGLYLAHAQDHAIICMDARGRILAWLGAAQQTLGYTPEEAVGQLANIIFTPEDRQRGFDTYELAVAAQDSRSEDDRWHLRKDGTRVWMTGSVTAVKDPSGILLGYVKVIRDKTDLRTRIEMLENQVQAARASQERTSRFMSTLGHELRNPLGPMQAACHIVSRLSTEPRIDRAVEVIGQQIRVLSRLAADLTEISRADAGKIKLDLKKTDLREVLGDAVFGMRHTAQDKGVHLECLVPQTPLDVMLDRERFPRVVMNIIGNAIKYTPPAGTVWIKATQEGGDVLLRVEDTGIGIAPDVLPRIFDLFTQQSQAAAMAPEGLGIGLAIVKQLVELHGGNVQARSAGNGKGAEFTVRLPAAPT
jgi:PAS domain S-box-containing protein